MTILALRLLFAAALYVAVAAVFLTLRRELRRTGVAGAAPPASAGRAWLTLVEAAPADGQTGRAVPLSGDVTIGRRPPADVLLRDDAVSGRHARIARRDAAWIVEDLGSTNGTYVNGRRLGGPQRLRPGDVLVTGGAAWRFDEDGQGVRPAGQDG